jgi:hypothetical protein
MQKKLEILNDLFQLVMSSYTDIIAHRIMRMIVIFTVVLGSNFIAEHLFSL